MAKRKPTTKRRAKGEGSLLTRKGCRFGTPNYDQNGKAVRVSTKTAVKQERSISCAGKWVSVMKARLGRRSEEGNVRITARRAAGQLRREGKQVVARLC